MRLDPLTLPAILRAGIGNFKVAEFHVNDRAVMPLGPHIPQLQNEVAAGDFLEGHLIVSPHQSCRAAWVPARLKPHQRPPESLPASKPCRLHVIPTAYPHPVGRLKFPHHLIFTSDLHDWRRSKANAG